MLSLISKHVFYPLWDIKDRSTKLREWRRLEQTQWLSGEELKHRQWSALLDMITHAYEFSPFYRNRMRQIGLHPSEIKTPEDFQKIPLTSKKDIREGGDELLNIACRKQDLARAKTGGSTGVSLDLFFDKRCQEYRNAAALRSDRWAGWDMGVYRGALWGNPPKGFSWKRSLRNALLDRTFVLDTMEMSPGSMGEFVASANKYKSVVLFGHAHSIFILAKFVRENGVRMVRPKGIISTSMMLLENERLLIEEVMGCRVTNRYGCEEVGLIASECDQHSGMHINVDHLYVEILREDGFPAKPGEPGKIILTDLTNRGMPLLRYKVEDVGVYSNKRCVCGRSQPMLASIAGRVADFLKKADGSMVAGVSLVERTLTAIAGIEQMQLVQNSLSEIVVNRVRGEGYNTSTDSLLVDEIKRVFGEGVDVKVNEVSNIQQSNNGKYRFSICNI